MSNAPTLSTPRKLGVLGSLYFAQGLPFGFFTQALPILLRKQGYSLSDIGLTSLLALPWALKFLWAPVVDRRWSLAIGRRRSWILPLQLATMAALVALAVAPGGSTAMLMTAVLALNLMAATQDIATDGLAVDLLAPHERGFANGLQVAGYRVGMIVGGGLILAFYDQLGSSGSFLVMAALIAASSLPIIVSREPTRGDRPSARSATPIHFLRRPGAAQLLVLIVVYKIGDAFAVGMLRPFLADSGLDLSDVGLLLGTAGFISGLLGALCGGALLGRLGRRNALVLFGLLQAATVAGYAYLAFERPGAIALYAVCAAEHFAGGMATAALFTCMMDWCRPETSATDYTVQASAVVIATGIAGALSGFSAGALGYGGHFCVATVLAVGSLAAVYHGFPAAAPSRASAEPEVAPCA